MTQHEFGRRVAVIVTTALAMGVSAGFHAIAGWILVICSW